MKKYILISYGEFNNTPKLQYLLDSISEITTTDVLTYKVLDSSIIINFGTNVEFNKLKQYFTFLFERISNFYFLTQHSKNMIISLPENENDSFLNLNVKKLDFNIEKLMDDIMTDNILLSGLESLNESMGDEECDEDVLIKKSLKKEYTLDDILDKINDKGVSSLTKEENEYLKNLSK